MRVLSEYKNIHTSILYIYVYGNNIYIYIVFVSYIDIYTYMKILFAFIYTYMETLFTFICKIYIELQK